LRVGFALRLTPSESIPHSTLPRRLLEILVYFAIDGWDLPDRSRLSKIDVPDDVHVEHVSVDALPGDWPERPEVTRAIGDAWLIRESTALLTVPSALARETFDVLLNPAQSDAARVVVSHATEHAIDPRLLE
jgi:hypothetical protein